MRKLYKPKTIAFLLLFLFLVLIVKKSVSDSFAPPAGYSGAPGESNCTSCHSGTSVNGGSYYNKFQLLTNMPNGRYALNTTYQITVRVVTAGCVKFGFETTVLNTSNTTAGTLTVTNATRTQKFTGGSRTYMGHTSNGTSALYTDSTDWTFNWLSPPTNVGNVTFYVAGNVTNNNSNYTFDTIYTKSFTFPAYTPPQGSISTNTNNICVNDSVRFTAGGTNSPTGYSWTFPGGIPSTSTLQVQWVKFPTVGTSLCSLYVTNTSGTSPLVTRNINIYAIPTSSITATGNTTFCQGDSVLLTGNTGSGNTYLWYRDGISTGLTGTSIYAKTGGSYTLKATSPGGCSVTSSPLLVTVNPMPTAFLSAVGPTTFCAGDSVLIKLTSTNGSNRQWYNGTTLLTGVTDTFYYAKSSGTYSVKLSNPNCSIISNTINVVVNTYPMAFFTSTPTGCIFILTANTGSNLRYQWFRNDTALVNDTNINYTINVNNGTYKVRVTNAGGCSLFSTSQTVNITNLPDVTLTITGSPTFCIGDSCILSVPLNAVYSYKWFKNGIALPYDTLPGLVVKDSGIYLVKVSNITCTNISNATAIKVLSYPDTSVTAINTTFCEGDSATLTAKNISGNTYQWYKNDTLMAGQTAIKLIVKKEGNYSVNVSNGHCNQNGSKKFIKVNPLPSIPTISRDKQTLTSTAAAYYQWYKDGTIINGSIAQSLTPTLDGKYKVVITDNNGCSNTSSEYNYTLTGIASIANINSIKIYPSPADKFITIETSSQNYHLIIYDNFGKLMLDEIIQEKNTLVDVSTWSKGIYIVYASAGEGSVVRKFVISR